MKKEKFYQWLDSVCEWMLLTEKPNTMHPTNKLAKKVVEDLDNGHPVILKLHVRPTVCKVCAIVTETDQVFNCRWNLAKQHWTLSCNKCRKSYAKINGEYQPAPNPRRPATVKKL